MDVDATARGGRGRGRARRLRRPVVPRRARARSGRRAPRRPTSTRSACWRLEASPGNLANRLRVHRLAPHPSRAGGDAGGGAALPRRACPAAGTTALSHLLARRSRQPVAARVGGERVDPAADHARRYHDDPRFVAARAAPSAVDLINPGFKAIHHDEPDDAMECTVLHAQHFQSLIYSTVFNLPELRRVAARRPTWRRRDARTTGRCCRCCSRSARGGGS